VECLRTGTFFHKNLCPVELSRRFPGSATTPAQRPLSQNYSKYNFYHYTTTIAMGKVRIKYPIDKLGATKGFEGDCEAFFFFHGGSPQTPVSPSGNVDLK
jgi:hypothetical protein